MKKSLLVVFGLLTLIARSAETTVASKNTLGINRVSTSGGTEVAVAVPWLKAAEEAMPVAELITTGLAAGDQIQVYDLAAKSYLSWSYNGTSWGEDIVTGVTVPSATTYTISRGTAFWYKPASENTKGVITQVGLYTTEPVTSKVVNVHTDGSAASFAKPVHSLLLNPKYTDFSIAAKLTAAKGCVKDDVVVIVANGARYRFNGEEWGQEIDQTVTKFGVTVTQKVFTPIGETDVDDGIVSAGKAFWYLSAGGEPEIEW